MPTIRGRSLIKGFGHVATPHDFVSDLMLVIPLPSEVMRSLSVGIQEG